MNTKIVRLKKISHAPLPNFAPSNIDGIIESITQLGVLLKPLILVRTGTETYQLFLGGREMVALIKMKRKVINAWVFENVETARKHCELSGLTDSPEPPPATKTRIKDFEDYMDRMLGLPPENQ
jgi:hypothetical protein